MLISSVVHDDDALACQFEVVTAAHDLRNRLGIAGYEIHQLHSRLDSRRSEPTVRDLLASVEHSLGQTITLMEAVLDSTRGDIRLPTATSRALDIVSLAKQVIAEGRYDSRNHNVELITTVCHLTGGWDASRLSLVLEVLLANAVQYSPAGSRIVLCVAQEGDDVVASVTDQGMGIAAADLPRVFEPFFRGRNAEMRAPGLGLGLSMARLIVEQYAGVLDVQSTEGVGSTFTIRLPLAST